MKKHFLMAVVSVSLGLSTAASYAQDQSPARPVKPKSPPLLDKEVKVKPMSVRANVGVATKSSVGVGQPEMAGSKAPLLIFNPKSEQTPKK